MIEKNKLSFSLSKFANFKVNNLCLSILNDRMKLSFSIYGLSSLSRSIIAISPFAMYVCKYSETNQNKKLGSPSRRKNRRYYQKFIHEKYYKKN